MESDVERDDIKINHCVCAKRREEKRREEKRREEKRREEKSKMGGASESNRSGGVEDGGMDEMEGCVGGGEAAEERGISGWGGMRL
ncbi:MAG: hypothetical protein Q9175_002250 [Cornicularia normoerica]